jgi:uncharacterized membrane protein
MRENRKQLREYWLICCLALIGAIAFSGFAIVRHERLNSSTYDLGIKDHDILASGVALSSVV